MVQYMLDYSIGDVVVVYNYYDEMSVGIIKKIIIGEKGIAYGVKIGFDDDGDDFIYVNPKDADGYRIAKCVGHYVEVDCDDDDDDEN